MTRRRARALARKTKADPAFQRAFKASIPIFFGYLPLGITFGLLFSRLGFSWLYSLFSAVIVFAGSAQYLSVELIGNRAGLIEIFVTILFLNLRHVFYGISLFRRFGRAGWLRSYLIFGLTDETYSVLTSSRSANADEDVRYCFYVTILNHSYWVAGCTIGALLGSACDFNTKGLEFTLTALFVVLTIEQALAVRRWFPFVVAGISAVVAIQIHAPQMLLISMTMVFLILGSLSVWEARR